MDVPKSQGLSFAVKMALMMMGAIFVVVLVLTTLIINEGRDTETAAAEAQSPQQMIEDARPKAETALISAKDDAAYREGGAENDIVKRQGREQCNPAVWAALPGRCWGLMLRS